MSIQFSNYASLSDYKDRLTSSNRVFYAIELPPPNILTNV